MNKIKVFSPGASGTRFLTNILEKSLPSNGTTIEQKGPTHLPFNVLQQNYIDNFQKIIFIYADPRNVFLSICKKDMQKRNRHLIHLGYLGTRNIPSEYIKKESLAFHKLSIQAGSFPGVEIKLIQKTQSFSGLETHFNSWLSANCSAPIAFIKYEHLPNVIDKVSDFINVTEPVKNKIHKRVKEKWDRRNSEYINHNCQEKLEQLFTPLLNIQKKLPSFWIKEPFK